MCTAWRWPTDALQRVGAIEIIALRQKGVLDGDSTQPVFCVHLFGVLSTLGRAPLAFVSLSGEFFVFASTALIRIRCVYSPAMSSGHGFDTGLIQGPSQLRAFRHVGDFVGKDPLDHAGRFSEAPWHDPASYRDDALLSQYLRAGLLPDGLSLGAIKTDDWARRCIAMNADLRRNITYRGGVRHREPIREARVAFTRLVYQRMHRFPGTTLVPPEFEFDFFLYRTRGEELYGERLVQQLENAVKWRGEPEQRLEALCFSRPILRVEFRFLRRYDDESFWGHIKWERRVRSRFGLLVPYQMVELESVAVSRRGDRYVSILEHWGLSEMPRGFFVDLPPVLTYAGRHLISDRSSGVRTLF